MPQKITLRWHDTVPIVFDDLSDAELGERLAARTLELVDISSESGLEADIAAHVLGVLQAGGVDARDAGDTCVIAGTEPRVVLAGHFDTVPAQENAKGGRTADAVTGLGASDMKSALAVIVELLLAGAPVTGVFFGREELQFAQSALTPLLAREALLGEAAIAIVMEPTSNELQAGCLGNINATWRFDGVAAHSGRPWQGDNAIERAAEAIVALRDAAPPDRRVLDGLEFTEVVSVTRVAGGIADNVIPDRVHCHVNYRYAPDRAAADAEAHLRRLCAAGALEITSNAPSGPVAVSHPLTKRLIAAGDLKVGPKHAWTPVAEFAAAGVPAVNFGPGDPAYAHKRDEQVQVAALVRCARTLAAFLSG
jgi:succinyl-diaminopimelate desuccinylase